MKATIAEHVLKDIFKDLEKKKEGKSGNATASGPIGLLTAIQEGDRETVQNILKEKPHWVCELLGLSRAILKRVFATRFN